jgi:hypothetical protein
MEGFSFVTFVTGLNRPNTGKEDDDDDHHPDDRGSKHLRNVGIPRDYTAQFKI